MFSTRLLQSQIGLSIKMMKFQGTNGFERFSVYLTSSMLSMLSIPVVLSGFV